MIFPDFTRWDTIDGRNPVPPGMYKNLVNNGTNYLSTGAGCLPSTDFSGFHQVLAMNSVTKTPKRPKTAKTPAVSFELSTPSPAVWPGGF